MESLYAADNCQYYNIQVARDASITTKHEIKTNVTTPVNEAQQTLETQLLQVKH